MTRNKAISVCLSTSKMLRTTVKRLMEWDESKTLHENAKSIGLRYQTCVNFKRRYRLKAKTVRTWEIHRSNISDDISMVRKMSGIGMNMESIGRVYGVSRARVHQILKRIK